MRRTTIFVHDSHRLRIEPPEYQEQGDMYVRTLTIEGTDGSKFEVHIFGETADALELHGTPPPVEPAPALDFVVDAPAEKGGVWPHSRMPTCPDCGWPPMDDPEDSGAPSACMCEVA